MENLIEDFNKLLKNFNCGFEIKNNKDIKRIAFSDRTKIQNFRINECPVKPVNTTATSGSTEKRLLIYHSSESYKRQLERLSNLFKVMGLDQNDIFLNLTSYRLNGPGRVIENSLRNVGIRVIPVGSLDDMRTLNLTSDLIKKLKPTVIDLYVNEAFYLFKKIGKEHTIKKTILQGEILLPEFKGYIEDISGTKVHNFYGSMEFSGIAISEKPGDVYLRINENGLFLEVLDEGGETMEAGKGKIVITDLHNFSMPFIRYILGDFVEIKRFGDKKYLKIFGRSDNYINIDGEVESKNEILNDLFKILKNPNFYLLIKKNATYQDVVILNIPGNVYKRLNEIKTSLKEKFNFGIDVRKTETPVPKTGTGKLVQIIDVRRLKLSDKNLTW